MKRLWLIVLLCVVGCAGNQVANNSTGNKRYFQYRHPLTSSITMQISTNNEAGCRFLLRSVEDAEDKLHTYCSDNSASKSLPYHTIIRNKALNYLFEVETINYPSCLDMVEKTIYNEKTKDNVELVSKCKMK